MIQLYIEEKLVELTDDIVINQTFETIDPEKLSSIKNSFSKTVDIPGTNNNNIMFGDIFRIDRYVPAALRVNMYGAIKNIDYQYDPHKKANYVLFKNGSIINRGYCTLDNIVVKPNDQITYKVTLYGGIGEFFYSLAYNNDGSPKTLYDMHWAWRKRNFNNPLVYDDPMNPEQENSDVIMNCTTRNVNMAYHLLKPLEVIYWDSDWSHWEDDDPNAWWDKENTYPYHITDIDKDVVFVPCYTGTYENFESNKMLVSTFNQNQLPEIPFMTLETKTILLNSFPDTLYDYSDDPANPTVYTTLNKDLESLGDYRYGIVTFSRELDPWEAGDIRLNEMPVAVRLSKLMRTISEPFNNGGYEVVWNQEILDSPYWNYSWVMLGKMKQDAESFYKQLSVTANEFNSKYVSLHYKNEQNMLNGSISTISQSETNYGDEYEIFNYNLQDENYSFTISLKPIAEFNVNSGTFNQYDINKLFNGWYYFRPGTPGHSSGNHYVPGVPPVHKCRYNYPTLVYNVYEEGILKYSFAFAFFLTNLLRSDQLYIQPDTSFKSNLEEFLNHRINQIKIYKVPVEVLSITSTSIYDHIKIIAKNIVDCDINIPVTLSGNISIKQQFVLTSSSNYNIMVYPSASQHTGFVWGYNSFEPATTPDTFFAFSGDAWPPLINSNTNNIFTYSFSLEKLDEIGISTTNTTGFNILKLTKHMLFAESKSPLKYLSDMIKMMNWRVTADNTTKKIYIDPLTKFYNRRTFDISEKIDYNRDITIKNVTTNAKRINFGLTTLESYPVSLFNRNDRDKFNLYHFYTAIEFNTTETNLLDNLIYKSTLDWQQNSIFYNIVKTKSSDGTESGQFPKAYNTQTISWTLFNLDEYDPNEGEGSIKRFEKIIPGCSSNENNLTASNDWLPKLSLFNKENKFVEPDTTLVFLNGFVANYDYYRTALDSTTLTPSSTISNSYVNSTSGNIVSDDRMDVYVYNNIDPTIKYAASGIWVDNYSGYIMQINYFSSSNNLISTELMPSQSIGDVKHYNDHLLNVPSNCTTIKMNVRKISSQAFNLKSVSDLYYSVFPRFSVSEDTYEQYYFNGGRCYVYDFKYNDANADWGMYSAQQKGTAFSCAVPFFTRELYNSYVQEPVTNRIKLEPANVYEGQYFELIDGFVYMRNDANYEMRIYTIDVNTMSNFGYTAQYPSDSTVQTVLKFNEGGGSQGVEGVVSPTQYEFSNATITVNERTATLYFNVYRQNASTSYIEVDVQSLSYPHWVYNNEIVASWNLVGQDNILNMYNLDKVRFLKDPNIMFSRQITTAQKTNIDNNEYTISLPTYMSNTIFDNNWKSYLYDLYDRNTRDVTLYIDLSNFGMANDIMRTIFYWKGFYWIPMKVENYKTTELGQDKYAKCTIHKINFMSTWLG